MSNWAKNWPSIWSIHYLGPNRMGKEESGDEAKSGYGFHFDEWTSCNSIVAHRDCLHWLVVALAGSRVASRQQLLVGLIVVDSNLNPS